MPLTYYSVKTRTGERLAKLPLTADGDLGTTISTYSSASFTLDLNDRECPADWADYVEPHLMSIVAVEEDSSGYSKPIWFGIINDTPLAHGAGVRINTASLEWYLSTHRVKDVTFGTSSDFMAIPTALIGQIETAGKGVGLAVSCPPSGVNRAMTIKHSDGKTVDQVFDEIALEWTIELDWAAETQEAVSKTFIAKDPFLGTITAEPEFVLTMPGNIEHWSFNAPAGEGKTATYIVVEGDGTGDLRVTSLPKIDTVREAAGYPRIELYRSVPGITNVNDANTLADQLAADLFTRKHIITVTARNAGLTSFKDITLGSSVRIMIDTPELQLDEVWRFVGWTMSADGATWAPTLAKLGTKVKDFPRAASPSDLARTVRDLDKKIDQTGSKDPLLTGYTFPPINGNSFAMDPVLGFGSYDANGNFIPLSSGGSGSIPWNPGSGSGVDSGETWDWGSEGSDPGTIPIYANDFDLTEPYLVANYGYLGTAKPATQNEGNIVFAHSGNEKAFTSISYAGQAPTTPPADFYGYLDVATGYLQHGQLAEWTVRASAELTADVMGPLFALSSAAIRPSPIIVNGEISPFYVNNTYADFSGQPFSVGGYLYIPVSIIVGWAANGTNAGKSALRFLRMQVIDFQTLGPIEPVEEADIPGAYSGANLRTSRAGSQVILATLLGNGGSILYAGRFDGATGDIGSEGFSVLPPTNNAPDDGSYIVAKSFGETPEVTGMSLFTTAGQLELGENLSPRDSNSSWHGEPFASYSAATAAHGRVVQINLGVDTQTNMHVVQAGMLDGTGITGIGTYFDDITDSPSKSFSYGGYVYGFSSSYDYSCKLTPKQPA